MELDRAVYFNNLSGYTRRAKCHQRMSPEAAMEKSHKSLDALKLPTSTTEPITVKGGTPLIVKWGTLQIRPWFCIIENLAVKILLKSTYIDNCIKIIFPIDREIVLMHYAPIPILGTGRYLFKIMSILSSQPSSLAAFEHSTFLEAKQQKFQQKPDLV